MAMRLVWAILLSVGLAACGGGGGSSAPAGPVPAAPTGVTAVAGDGYILLDAATSTDATLTGYNVYWSNTTGVTKANGTKFKVGAAPQVHTALNNGATYYYVITAVNANGESAASAQVSATPAACTLNCTDPFYQYQWNLKNTSQVDAAGTLAKGGEDINVEPAWVTRNGTGVRIAIVDDGLEMAHEDLASNVGALGTSHNYIATALSPDDPTNDPNDPNQAGAGHGTACAGIAAARDLNGVGVRGVAPRATLVGYNLLQNSTVANEVDAMTRNAASVSVSSNSWGAADGTGKLYASDQNWRNSIDSGLATGRNGLGTIYTWAAGNGAKVAITNTTTGIASVSLVDNSNYDGQANYRGVIAVAAVNDQGKQSSYSESGANVWVSAPGGEFCDTHAITTVDRTGTLGHNSGTTPGDYTNGNYTRCMNGTSSATPTVAGVVALILEAKPTLTWRDVRTILAQSARMNDPANPGWYTPSTGFHFNHKYGFGVVDAEAAVTLASSWTNLPAQKTFTPASASPNSAIPDNSITGAPPSTITVSGSTITSIEFIDVTFSAADHTYLGDLTVTLTSPLGKTTVLAETHPCVTTDPNTGKHVVASCGTSYTAWRFGDAGHMGESADGIWTLNVYDLGVGDTGHLQSWGLKFYGH